MQITSSSMGSSVPCDMPAGAPGEVATITDAPRLSPGPLPHAHTHVRAGQRQRVIVRNRNRDFVVDEQLALDDSNDGQHCYLQIARSGLSTADVAKQLAQTLGVANADVGYAGMKDKFALTRQWFSVPAPTRAAEGYDEFQATVNSLPTVTGDWRRVADDEDSSLFAVTSVSHQPRKLRRGDHTGNRFSIVLLGAELDETLEKTLTTVSEQGVPNYFGHQRFGNDGDNVRRALAWLPGQRGSRRSFQRGLHLSVLRAQLFNQVLATRVRRGNWNVRLPGDDTLDDLPTGPLWGRGRLSSHAEAAELEQATLLPWWPVALALEHTGLKQQRRSLVVRPQDMHWREEQGGANAGSAVRIDFSLPPGSFATSVLRELASFPGDLADD